MFCPIFLRPGSVNPDTILSFRFTPTRNYPYVASRSFTGAGFSN
jgi:hypothetical protein